MYEVSVESTFSATHHVQLPDGRDEPTHGHDWRVKVIFVAAELSEHGMVIDFIHARSQLQQVLACLHHRDLNSLSDFAQRNPTAEIVASFVFQELRALGLGSLKRVEVTEAPGCVAAYQE